METTKTSITRLVGDCVTWANTIQCETNLIHKLSAS